MPLSDILLAILRFVKNQLGSEDWRQIFFDKLILEVAISINSFL